MCIVIDLETFDGKTIRKFQVSWYTKYAWLAGSENLASKHAISKTHLTSQEQFMLLGANRIEHALLEGRRLAAIKHNENVGVNRRILTRLIQVVCFLGKQEIAFRGHNEDSSSINKGNYLELLDLLSRDEQLLREHFMSNSVFKGTSSDIQNDLISCITSVLKTKILNELQKANFISIQADETTDVSYKSASGLSEILLTEMKNWNIGDKLMCQTYDGAAVMAGQKNGVQAIIKQSYPKAMFIHCYAHQLNLVFLHGSKSIKSDVELWAWSVPEVPVDVF
ncbi:zinc finger MYM-type protein 1-like [Aphis craccivora]|uniref:Zinc finger MYM-type protein 1-like n=1 Tax=Aphis craccivora TaxID=307492 RepID=A0A6G0YF45_APHCR|nr:zinc finger MYM-type protein 1-like [Aphis craccivora]